MEKELLRFVEDLWKRGLLSASLDKIDYEKVIYEYLHPKVKTENG